jgi:hypothetical protein
LPSCWKNNAASLFREFAGGGTGDFPLYPELNFRLRYYFKMQYRNKTFQNESFFETLEACLSLTHTVLDIKGDVCEGAGGQRKSADWSKVEL